MLFSLFQSTDAILKSLFHSSDTTKSHYQMAKLPNQKNYNLDVAYDLYYQVLLVYPCRINIMVDNNESCGLDAYVDASR